MNTESPVPDDLRSRTIRTAVLMGLRVFLVGGLHVTYVATTARLLGPAEFGQFALVMTVVLLCEVFSQTGVDVSLVRKRECIAHLLDPFWSLQAVRGLVLGALVFGLARPLSMLLGAGDALVSCLQLAAIIPVVDGLQGVGPLLLGRDLRQGKLTVAELAYTTVQVPVAVALVWWLRSPIALVLGMIVLSFFRMASTYVVHEHRPRFTRNWSALRPFLRFGVFYNLASGASYLIRSLDRIIIGRMLGDALLGLYDRCIVLCAQAVHMFPKIVASAVFPSLAMVQGDQERYRRNRRRFISLVVAGFAGLAVVMAVFADPIVPWVLGEQFVESVPLLRILVGYLFCHGVSLGLQSLLVLHRRTDLHLAGNVAHVISICILLPLLIPAHGLMGAAWGVTGASAVGLLVTTVFIVRMMRGEGVPEASGGSPEGGAPDPVTETPEPVNQ